MNQHPLDLVRYRWAATTAPTTELDADQVLVLDEHARRYRAWVGRHPAVHNVATALVILMEHKHTAGDAVRLIVEGCQRGLRRHEARLIELANTWRRP